MNWSTEEIDILKNNLSCDTLENITKIDPLIVDRLDRRPIDVGLRAKALGLSHKKPSGLDVWFNKIKKIIAKIFRLKW